MDGIHDLGGKHGYGAIVRDADEPVFRERWEARVFAIMRGASRHGHIRNTDQFRHAIERIDPVAYLTHGYYGRWLGGLETLLREAGVVDADELAAAVARLGGDPQAPPAARPSARADAIADVAPPESRRELSAAPRFGVGDRVRTRTTPSSGHTRLPAYARGRIGSVTALHGGWVFPDSHAHGHGEQPRHLYSVAFDGAELWGDEAEPNVVVSLDLFEPYLEVP